jgi:hypothetical protein
MGGTLSQAGEVLQVHARGGQIVVQAGRRARVIPLQPAHQQPQPQLGIGRIDGLIQPERPIEDGSDGKGCLAPLQALLNSAGAHLDAARRLLRDARQPQREHAVLQLGLNAGGVDLLRQLELPEETH